MENIHLKADFLRSEYTQIIKRIPADAPRLWGKMDVQQMVEHMTDYVRIASGKTPMEVVTPEDKISRYQSFLASEKPFQENTPNALMPETPPGHRHPTRDAALAELQEEIDHFFSVYAIDPSKQTPNPFFGVLGFDQQVQLLHKHAWHHLRQFGVNP